MKDTDFIRGEVPMTKEEIRSIVLSKLDLQHDDCLMDIGAGTGSVSIEAAMQLTSGRVLGIEHKTEAVELIKQNMAKHKVSNLQVVQSKAPEGMENVVAYNKFFIGGSGGNLPAILCTILDEAPRKSIIVVTAILLDTMSTAYDFFKTHDFDFELIQVGVSKVESGKKAAMLLAQNPIFIITATKK
ncbi:precorrin-6Y C5,15-methyltransferase (decarboxylating) subunit CbiT [Labilibacter sediminis]|nr:precorrin-6Y C5,15-methyltransferase (decarboxylating) subunit CbiT [Labilibacter sediminis]